MCVKKGELTADELLDIISIIDTTTQLALQSSVVDTDTQRLLLSVALGVLEERLCIAMIVSFDVRPVILLLSWWARGRPRGCGVRPVSWWWRGSRRCTIRPVRRRRWRRAIRRVVSRVVRWLWLLGMLLMVLFSGKSSRSWAVRQSCVSIKIVEVWYTSYRGGGPGGGP